MKRPSGFDAPSATRAPRPAAPQRRPADRSADRPADRPADRVADPVTEPVELPVAPAGRDAGALMPRPAAAVRRAVRERRRVERREIRRFTERGRRRRRAWLLSLGTVLLLVAVVALVAVSPLLALREIRVVGTSRVDAAAVERRLDAQLGTPLPLLDLARIDRTLGAFPLIRSYSLESLPPSTLVVRIVERSPIGVVEDASGYSLVDPARVVISSSAERPKGYPLIETAAGRGFEAAAAVLLALPASFRSTVDSVAASSTDDVVLRLTGGQSVVWGGPEDAALKAAVLGRLIAATHGGAASYDVSSPRAPVTR